jgi:hypothetical protein
MNYQIRTKTFKIQKTRKKRKKAQLNKISFKKLLVRRNTTKRKTKVLVKKNSNKSQQILRYSVRNP